MTVAIRQLAVPRHQRLVFQGQSVTIFVLFELLSDYNTSTLLDLAEPPRMTVFKPDGTIYIQSIEMIRVSIGTYYLNVQTAGLPVGVHYASILGLWGSDEALLHKVVVFKVIRAFDTGDVTAGSIICFAIKDQSSAIWYWWFGSDNTLHSTVAPPAINGKQTIILPISPIPYWLEMLNVIGLTRYVYPQLSADAFVVQSSPPPIGTGYVGSPTLISASNTQIRIGVAVDDTIIGIVL